MSYVNAEKFIDELANALAIIDQDPSTEGTTSNIIDRSARSIFMLLMSVLENCKEDSKERFIREDVRDLKERMSRLEVEVARLYREKRLGR